MSSDGVVCVELKLHLMGNKFTLGLQNRLRLRMNLLA